MLKERCPDKKNPFHLGLLSDLIKIENVTGKKRTRNQVGLACACSLLRWQVLLPGHDNFMQQRISDRIVFVG